MLTWNATAQFYIYIYIERERENCKFEMLHFIFYISLSLSLYIYIYIYIQLRCAQKPPPCRKLSFAAKISYARFVSQLSERTKLPPFLTTFLSPKTSILGAWRLHFGTLGLHFEVFLRSGAGPWTPWGTFLKKCWFWEVCRANPW